MIKRFLIGSAVCVAMGFAVQARADLVTFDLSYSGASLGNTAVGTGTITFDTSLLLNPGATDLTGRVHPPATTEPGFVTAFSLTISGATNASDDGTFGLADYDNSAPGGDIFIDTNGGTLNLNEQLFGQPTSKNPFGSKQDGTAGDFNFFSNGNDPHAPNGTFNFTITTDDGFGDSLVLTSMAPASSTTTGGPGSAAPLPSGFALGLLGLGTLGFAVRRRKLVGCQMA